MTILVGYATNSSGTLTASHTIVKVLREKGFDVTQSDIREVNPEMLYSYDLIIFGSPSWYYNKTEGMPHEFFTDFMKKMEGKTVPGKQFAIFGLGDTAYMYFCRAVDHLEAFVRQMQGEILLPSLRIDGFFFNQKQNEQYIADWAEEISKKLVKRGISSISTTL